MISPITTNEIHRATLSRSQGISNGRDAFKSAREHRPSAEPTKKKQHITTAQLFFSVQLNGVKLARKLIAELIGSEFVFVVRFGGVLVDRDPFRIASDSFNMFLKFSRWPSLI
ncbi:hypothetical protein GWI33_014019 [Rhynchophorus ferrugineus]|uniref:Uncharacterized protein n=1 Tax=Rhynchophorus ferrugineus TaxID=354439 RepID=A0A834I2B3_RHYFE|nr:hypothetical protein GWI33_014019 [Rhynchophorus ferrugineus]